MHSVAECVSKLLIWLDIHIFPHRMHTRLSCSNCEYQPDLNIRPQPRFDAGRTSRQQRSRFRRSLRHLEGNFGCDMERRRNRYRTSMIAFRQSSRCDKGVVRLAIGFE